MNDQLAEFMDDLHEPIQKEMRKRSVPGLSLGILYNGSLASTAFGVTNIEHPLEVNDQTLFQIGSISKTFVSTAEMRLVEMGELSLNAPIRKYLPRFKVTDDVATSKASIWHLLTHTAGWEGDFFIDTGSGIDALSRFAAEMASLKQLVPFGSTWSYNNAGFNLLGRIIEVVANLRFQDALKTLVFEPLGLTNCFFEARDVITNRFAVGHMEEGDKPIVARPWALPCASHPAGGVMCHIMDILRYAAFHLGDGITNEGQRVLETESITEMKKPQVSIWRNEEKMGLSWFLNNINGVRQIYHWGSTNGQVSSLILVPEFNFALAAMTNGQHGAFVIQMVIRAILKAVLSIDVPEPVPMEPSDVDLNEVVGFYSRPFSDLKIKLHEGNLEGTLTYKGGFPTKETPPRPSPPPMPLAPCEPDRFFVTQGILKDQKIDVFWDDSGDIKWIRFGSRIHCKVG